MIPPTSQTILITGSSSGIGLQAALDLQQQGHNVIATARKDADIARLKIQGLTVFRLDVSKIEHMTQQLAPILEHCKGRIDALINNAGYGAMGALEDLTPKTLQAQFQTNVFGLFALIHHIIPLMRKQGRGRIINLSSVLGLVTLGYRGAYCASKYAVESLSDALRQELHGSGITISLINPGPIKSQFRSNATSVFQDTVYLEQSAHKAQYAKLLQRQNSTQEAPFTLPPQAVVKKIQHALTAAHPKARYYVTLPTYILALANRLLPRAWLDKLLRKISLS